MDLAEVIRLIILAQESIEALHAVGIERRRVHRLIEAASNEGIELTADVINAELDDLAATIERARENIPADPSEGTTEENES